MQRKKARKLKIKIIENGDKKLNLTLPLFIISTILFFVPSKILNKWTEKDIDIKKMYKELKNQGKGTKINVKDDNDQVKIEFK